MNYTTFKYKHKKLLPHEISFKQVHVFIQIKKPSPVQFRPYQIPCDLCDRTYATEGALAKHMKTHEDPESTNRHKCKV